jgi:hypothetical protein
MAELCFVVSLLVVRVPAGCRMDEIHLSPAECRENTILQLDHGVWNMKKCAFFNTVHNCVYFAISVLNQQRQLLECFDKITLKMLADNRYILTFMPDLYHFINGLLTTDMAKARRCVSLVAAVQGNVSFQSDTDNRHNFPTDQAFHVFRKQRDAFYEILRTWETDHMLPDWSFATALGPRIRTLLSLHNEPANFVHFARLFRSQLLGTCNGYSSCSVSITVHTVPVQAILYSFSPSLSPFSFLKLCPYNESYLAYNIALSAPSPYVSVISFSLLHHIFLP